MLGLTVHVMRGHAMALHCRQSNFGRATDMRCVTQTAGARSHACQRSHPDVRPLQHHTALPQRGCKEAGIPGKLTSVPLFLPVDSKSGKAMHCTLRLLIHSSLQLTCSASPGLCANSACGRPDVTYGTGCRWWLQKALLSLLGTNWHVFWQRLASTPLPSQTQPFSP